MSSRGPGQGAGCGPMAVVGALPRMTITSPSLGGMTLAIR